MPSLSNVRMKPKLISLFLLVGITPLAICAWWTYRGAESALQGARNQASEALKQQALNQLVSIRDAKKQQIQKYFEERQIDLDVLVEHVARTNEEGGTHLDGAEAEYLTKFNNQYGYYDTFLMDKTGHCFFTVCHEADYQTNLVDGKYKDSNLGSLVRQVMGTRKFGFADFEPYAPSNGDPAAFIAQPVLDDHGDVELIVALQMPLDAVNEIMNARAGMGETGETYVVGPDKRMRSDSFLDPEGHSVIASFAGTVEKNGVDTEAIRETFSGNTDSKIIIDYNGNPVLSAYTPIKVLGATWALVAEIDEAEAFEAVSALEESADEACSKLSSSSWIIALFAAGIIAVIAFAVALMISRPIERVAEVLKALASGDYSQQLEQKFQTEDEIGQMASALNTAVTATAKAMQDVKEAAEREQEAQTKQAAEARQRAETQRREAEENEGKVRQILEVAERVAQRDYSKEVQVTGDDALGQLGDGLREFFANKRRLEEEADALVRIDEEKTEALRRKVDILLEVVAAAAEGDLTRTVLVEGDEPVDELAAGLKKMLEDLSGIIGQVVESAAQFNEGSRVIAESSQSLASGAQTQSASVEEVSAAIEELTTSIDRVKSNACQANDVVTKTNALADQGAQAVEKSSEAMELIRRSSDQIAEIIQVISEIASQTNLLALNAAIEAARAGEHGMGFAVVADEVRKLAERSNQAAGEITALIRESGNRVQEGVQLSHETGQALKEIAEGVQATVAQISEITTATVEQASNAEQVSDAIRGIAQVTEQAAAGSEEMASSSEQLGAQADALRNLVGRFAAGTSGAESVANY